MVKRNLAKLQKGDLLIQKGNTISIDNQWVSIYRILDWFVYLIVIANGKREHRNSSFEISQGTLDDILLGRDAPIKCFNLKGSNQLLCRKRNLPFISNQFCKTTDHFCHKFLDRYRRPKRL